MSWNKIWDQVFQSQEWGKYPGEDLIQFVAGHFYRRDRARTRILEIGCGPGANLWYLAREGFDAYGIDGSTTAIDRAKKRLKCENLSAHLDIGDISALPYQDHFFDAAIDVGCLCCNTKTDSKMILREVSRVLKPQGLFYSRTFSDKTYVGKSQKELAKLEFTAISDGPLAGMGLVRLANDMEINAIYSESFEILSRDIRESSRNNGDMTFSDWCIICAPRKL